MRQSSRTAIAALAVTVNAASLSDVCTVSNVQAAIHANGTLLGIDLIPSAVQRALSTMHLLGNKVIIKYTFPSPFHIENHFYIAGGGGYSLSSDATGGLAYGAVGGATDAGYDAFDYSYDEVVLFGNGSINWDATYMFGYQALGEMTQVGKTLTKGSYGLSADTKVYIYYKGCSDGGREGISQVQSTISSSLGFGFSKCAQGNTTSTTPAQNETVTAEGVAFAQAIYDGLHNSDNKRAYLS
ncbi:hypothetical protein BTUL_0391g00040 [Botrytis tulipae]|uniref:Carboxylic ester hydrolase n=1 Tax=Botrytis tulipae TaxID=87230 RepID=A0A4Z1E496_9HELO|nr:hypothetical protein BTUL_0391g00040 [Botrytis tulipae]